MKYGENFDNTASKKKKLRRILAIKVLKQFWESHYLRLETMILSLGGKRRKAISNGNFFSVDAKQTCLRLQNFWHPLIIYFARINPCVERKLLVIYT